MPEEMRDLLNREANLNGRSLNTEILGRLQHTLEQQRKVRASGYRVTEPLPEQGGARDDLERSMLAMFRKLSPDKQLALLSLFK